MICVEVLTVSRTLHNIYTYNTLSQAFSSKNTLLVFYTSYTQAVLFEALIE